MTRILSLLAALFLLPAAKLQPVHSVSVIGKHGGVMDDDLLAYIR